MLEKSKLYKRRENISDLPYDAEGLLDTRPDTKCFPLVLLCYDHCEEVNSIYSIMPYRLLKMREEEDSWSRIASLPDRIREKVWLGELIVSAL